MHVLAAIVVVLVAASAERLHAARVRRVRRLAFGAEGRPARWTVGAPVLRCVGAGAAAWGALVLYAHEPLEAESRRSARASRQMLICLDVSPSMQIKDAGPDPEKVTRARWAGQVVQAMLDRLDMTDTRITLVAFYTRAMPVLIDTTDRNVVANLLDGLPMHVAFRAGGTNITSGVNEALSIAKPWARNSATLVVVSDGDVSSPIAPDPCPRSLSDVLVLGVGDPGRASTIAGHGSRQDAASLKLLAARLGGTYFDANRKHVPSTEVRALGMTPPKAGQILGMREAGIASLAGGCAALGLVGPALMVLGLKKPSRRPRPGPRAGDSLPPPPGTAVAGATA